MGEMCLTNGRNGYRTLTPGHLRADTLAQGYEGLPGGKSKAHVWGAFRTAARAIGVPSAVVALIEALLDRTRKQDWLTGRRPVVWASNDAIAADLQIGRRQTQNLLRRAGELGLIAWIDSPSRARFGRRGSDDHIIDATGIDLSPLGARLAEFEEVGQRAQAEAAERTMLRRRLTKARQGIIQAVSTATAQGIGDQDWLEAAEEAATVRTGRNSLVSIDALARLVSRLEHRHREFLRQLTARVVDATAQAVGAAVDGGVDNSPPGAGNATLITVTPNQPLSEESRNSAIEGGSRRAGDTTTTGGASCWVDEDLRRHGVDPAFIQTACPDAHWQLQFGVPLWRDLEAIATDEKANLLIDHHTWADARRVLGGRGAAAAVFVISQRLGEIDKPAAYLRGMINKALVGELRLGRTFHGLMDAVRKSDDGGFRARNPEAGWAPYPSERRVRATIDAWLAPRDVRRRGEFGVSRTKP